MVKKWSGACWQGDDGLQPIVLQNPPADFALAASGIAREQGRPVHHDGNPAAAILRVLHPAQHVGEEQQLPVADPGQPSAEPPGVSPFGPAISSQHEARGANVAFADGRVVFLPANTPWDLLRALLTEGLDDAKMARIDELAASQPKPNDYLGLRLVAWALSILALLIHGLVVDVRRKRAAGKTASDPTTVSPRSGSDS